MKKNYFMLVCLVLFSAFGFTAQAVSVENLYGDYKFQADIELTAAGDSYKKLLTSECIVTIGEDLNGIYDGAIFGFAGALAAMEFNFRDNTLEIMNSNSVSVGSGLLFADADANNPYGVFKDGTWEHMPFAPTFTYNPSTKEISVPDFTVVTVANPRSDEKGTVIATYTNVKIARIGGEDPDVSAFEWAGTHTVNAATVTAYDGNEYPSSFDITIVKDGDEYIVTNIWGYDVVNLNNGGIAFTVAADGWSAQMATGGYITGTYPVYYVIKDMNAQTEPINFYLNADGTISVDDFFIQGLNYETNATTPVVFYQGVTIGTAADEPGTSAFSWVGQHAVKVGKVDAYDGQTYPTEFTMTVIEDAGEYLVTEFFSTDVTALNNGGIVFTVAADGKSAEMPSASFVGGSYPDYWVIYDMNAQENPIRFVLNEDGSVTVDNFFVKNCNFETGAETPAAYFQDVTILAAGGSEPEAFEFDWTGTWEVVAGDKYAYDDAEYADKFYMTIIEDAGEMLITQFLSNDVTGLNYGGILLTVASDNRSADMTTGTFVGGAYPDYLAVYDMNGTTGPVSFVANANGTISIAALCIAYVNYTTNETTNAVFYQNLTATKCPTGIDEVKGENGTVEGIFDIQGRRVEEISAPGLYIIDGRKVFVK